MALGIQTAAMIWIYIVSVYAIGLGIVLDQEMSWYWSILLFLISPGFVPFFIGVKVSQI